MRDTAYFSTAAQVLPVLFILIVVEFRILGGSSGGGRWWASARQLPAGRKLSVTDSLVVVVICFSFVMAEVTSFATIRSGKPTDLQYDFVEAMTVVLLLMVIFVPAQPHVEALLDRTPAYRLKVWMWRRTGTLRPQDPDPPKAHEYGDFPVPIVRGPDPEPERPSERDPQPPSGEDDKPE